MVIKLKKNRIVWIDLLKVISIFSVILMHIIGNTINGYSDLPSNASNIFIILAYLLEFSIPAFVMISGIVLLKKDEITYKEIFKKYISKVLITIGVVGTIMIVMEEYFMHRPITIQVVINRLLTGQIWAHMWYLYLLLGLYLITPICSIIVKNIKKNDYKTLLIILFIISILINTINDVYKIKLAFNMLEISGYIFYFLYGYYIYKYGTSKKYNIVNYIFVLLSIIYTVFHVLKNPDLNAMYSYLTFIPFIIASGSLLIFKDIKVNKKLVNIITSISTCMFGIYVYHQFFINIIYKFIKLSFIKYHPYIGLLTYSFAVFALSYVLTYILKKLPFFKKYLT